jgi:hypothetical protein
VAGGAIGGDETLGSSHLKLFGFTAASSHAAEREK